MLSSLRVTKAPPLPQRTRETSPRTQDPSTIVCELNVTWLLELKSESGARTETLVPAFIQKQARSSLHA